MKSTIDVNALQLFRAVVETGSFTGAALLLEKDKAHVSRTISRLEQQLGVQLLWRSTRRLAVTELGRDLYERGVGILNALEDTELAIAQSQSEPKGLLRLTCGTEFGVIRVSGWIARYMNRYPGVKVEAEYTNRLVDIIHEGIDIAIRIGSLADSDLSARTLGHIRYGLYATREYLDIKGEPEQVDELEQHQLIMFSPRGKPHWLLVNGTQKHELKTEPVFRVNNTVAARDVALQHHGITLLPRLLVENTEFENMLVRVLPEWVRAPVVVSAVFSSSRYMTPKVRAFIDLAIEQWRE